VSGLARNGEEASASLDIQVRKLPRIGSCSGFSFNENGEPVTPAYGYAFTTKYTVDCSYFPDNETSLTYKFYIKHNGKL